MFSRRRNWAHSNKTWTPFARCWENGRSAAQPGPGSGPAPALILQVLTQVSPQLSLGAQSGAADVPCRRRKAAEASPASCPSQLGDYPIISKGPAGSHPLWPLCKHSAAARAEGEAQNQSFSEPAWCARLSRTPVSCSSSSIPSPHGKTWSRNTNSKKGFPQGTLPMQNQRAEKPPRKTPQISFIWLFPISTRSWAVGPDSCPLIYAACAGDGSAVTHSSDAAARDFFFLSSLSFQR